MEAYSQTRPCDLCHRDIYLQSFELHRIKCEKQGASRIRQSYFRPPESEVQVPEPPSFPRADRPQRPEHSNLLRQSLIRASKLNRQEAIVCPQCSSKLSLEELESHSERCEAKLKRCQYCNDEFLAVLLKDHQQLCEAKKQLQRMNAEEEQHQFRSFGDRQSSGSRSRSNGSSGAFPQSGRSSERNSSNNSYRSARSNNQRQQGASLSPFTLMFGQHGGLGQRGGLGGFSLEGLIRNLINLEHGGPEGEGLSNEQLSSLNRRKYVKRGQDDLCTICYCNLEEGEDVIQLQCLHLYHDDCLTKWLEQSKKCPICKHEVQQ